MNIFLHFSVGETIVTQSLDQESSIFNYVCVLWITACAGITTFCEAVIFVIGKRIPL